MLILATEVTDIIIESIVICHDQIQTRNTQYYRFATKLYSGEYQLYDILLKEISFWGANRHNQI